ncbi:CIC11C00000005678 [Sungouiella intermedia]|uniref:histidine kinase n=1 Tax=Sungouiella intermedia TaxID=45354 RepID=A0A1L0BEV9_9ASCO|nr:CIC11C00000005678 [[Candida] intermedia]
MAPKRNGKKRRLKVGIRPQLIILVCFASLFSLLILAIVSSVYFLKNLSNLQADRLEVVSQLKATQVKQSIQYIYYQVYWLSLRDTVTSPLSYYRAGNNSNSVFSSAQTALDLFLATSETFASAKLYDLDLNVVANSSNDQIRVSQSTQDALYPLQKNISVPTTITLSNSSYAASSGFITGPLPNSTDVNSTYFFGLTLPVYANTSIILDEPTISGYLTVIANAQTIESALEYLTLGGGIDSSYRVIAIKGYYANNTMAGDPNALIGWELIFPISNTSRVTPNRFYPIDSSPSVRRALRRGSGTSTHIESMFGTSLAIAFTRIRIDKTTFWSVLIEQRRSTFLEPVRKLRDIMIGVVLGIGAFMCLITFPLAVWFVNPITKLKEATEAITRSKKEKDNAAHTNSINHPSGGSGGGGIFSNISTPPSHMDESEVPNRHISKRNSVNTASSGSSTVYSTGIRLPGKIPQSKKLFKDELTELSDAFNIMTEELEKQYTHLEDRVKLRTKELEASKIEAEAANEAKTVFIANISHELRTPLNGILGMTSIAMEETDHLLIQDSLKLIHRSGELLLHILTELLTYSKNTLNRSKLEKSNFQILEVVYQVRSIFGKLALDQRVNFRITVKPNVLRKLILFGDSNRIIQVVMNLVSNSLKFTPVDGSVDVIFKLIGEYDHEASKAIDYEKVLVKKADEYENTSDLEDNEDHPEQNGLDQMSGINSQNGFFKPRSNSASIPLNNITPARDSNSVVHSTNDEIDTQSLVTITTSEYERNMFNNQFVYSKPLPQIPTSRHSSPPTSPNATRSSSIHEEKNGVLKPEPSELFPSPPEKSSSLGIHKSYLDTQTGFSTSTNQLSNSELVKNDKVYKMRKLYVPKSWAIQIEVRDTGSGIEPALQEKVFEPFIQGDQTLSRSYGGTGLGLSICRQLAKMMHGTLTLRSTLGKGSSFIFTLPLPQNGEIVVPDQDMEEFSNDEFNPKSKVNRKVVFDIQEGDSEESPKVEEKEMFSSELSGATGGSTPSTESLKPKLPKKPTLRLNLEDKPVLLQESSTGTVNQLPAGDSILTNLSHIKILVAEDNSVNQEVIKRMLRLEGFTDITMAGNGAEAVELVQKAYDSFKQFDIIFMDVQMPKMDGLTATKLIKTNLQFKKPIIALTAFADESNVKECLNCGMSGFLSKPIKRTNLRQIITKFSPDLLSEVVTTPRTDDEEKRLGFSPMSPLK